MLLRIKTPNEGVTSRLKDDYYQHNERVYGPTVLRNLSLSSIRKGKEDSAALAFIDHNYAKTLKDIDRIYSSPFCEFAGLYADNDYLIAHTTIEMPILDDDTTASVTDILIKHQEEFKPSEGFDINITFNIYCQFISFIEDYLASTGMVSQIDYITDGKDGDFWEAMRENGYDINDSGDLDAGLLRFTKDLRERDVVRGRNNPNQ